MTLPQPSLTDRTRRAERRRGKHELRTTVFKQLEEIAEDRKIEADDHRTSIINGVNPITGEEFSSITEFHTELDTLEPLTPEERDRAEMTYFTMRYAEEALLELAELDGLTRPSFTVSPFAQTPIPSY